MKIAFLAPDDTMFQTATATLDPLHSDILIAKGLLSKGVEIARHLVADGVEIIITRGGTASAIKSAGLEVSVVELAITGFDMIRTVERAKTHGSRVAVVAFQSMVLGIDCLGPILGIDLRKYILDSEFAAEATVLRAFAEGADVVVGGVITVKTAQLHGFPAVLIDSGAEGIFQAAQEAKRLSEARQLEKVKASLFKAVLDFAHEGVISIDQDQTITVFNPLARRITGIDGAKAIGHKIGEIWPELKLEKVLVSAKDDLGHILRVGGKRIACNKVPIVVNKQVVGAVANFQDVGKIQQMEERIRREIYASGHVATFTFDDVLGSTSLIQDTVRIAKEFAATQSAVLILGETGTGKEVFAQSIHNYSKRANGPFVAINCAALPGQILESELFGYVGGAFTGANKEGKPGLFEVAHRGTIFLDEIAEMDYTLQGKLLRVLQEKKVVRLGSDKVIPVDVRIIAATNRHLKQLVAGSRFRADLYYRLNVLRLRIPPLRERTGDIAIYARYFLDHFASAANRRLLLTDAAIQLLCRYSWPGNVRELQNTLERAAVICPTEKVEAPVISQMLADEQDNDLQEMIVSNETEEIKKALAMSRGKYSEAAKILGISRSTLWRKLRSMGLK
ncbi:MAG: sigma 54-interacting transcriptional regulator [Negativicutes bacterium]|nr:sigma 54-interacting transcriptional regulator [Negativicutes bacterium]